MGCIPTAPPMIHLIFPKRCGSGKNGASPNVRLAIDHSFQLLMDCFIYFLNSLSFKTAKQEILRGLKWSDMVFRQAPNFLKSIFQLHC